MGEHLYNAWWVRRVCGFSMYVLCYLQLSLRLAIVCTYIHNMYMRTGENDYDLQCGLDEKQKSISGDTYTCMS